MEIPMKFIAFVALVAKESLREMPLSLSDAEIDKRLVSGIVQVRDRFQSVSGEVWR